MTMAALVFVAAFLVIIWLLVNVWKYGIKQRRFYGSPLLAAFYLFSFLDMLVFLTLSCYMI
jgi:hypothetical protein